MAKYNWGQIIFIDIETVSGKASYDELGERMQKLWDTKAEQVYRRQEVKPSPAEAYTEKAGIFAEFGKIMCISVGILTADKQGDRQLRVKSFCSDDEAELLLEFKDMLVKNPRFRYFCGHNIKEFDIPYICRRMLVNAIQLPHMLDISGKKPWELDYLLDTMTMWRFGDFKNYTSLSLLTGIFDIPTPKDDIDGSQVGRVFWEEKDLKRIAIYCEKDVVATAQLLLKMEREPLIADDQVFSLTAGE